MKELLIINAILACVGDTKYYRRHLSDIKGVVIHRIDVGSTAEEVADFFRGYPAIGKMAYTFFIRKDGTVEQALPLSYRAPGGKVLNRNFIQIGVDGDFTKHPMTPAQSLSLKRLVTGLCAGLDILDVRGHMETQGASSDPHKKCPGDHINLRALREMVIKEVNTCEPISGLVI